MTVGFGLTLNISTRAHAGISRVSGDVMKQRMVP